MCKRCSNQGSKAATSNQGSNQQPGQGERPAIDQGSNQGERPAPFGWSQLGLPASDQGSNQDLRD